MFGWFWVGIITTSQIKLQCDFNQNSALNARYADGIVKNLELAHTIFQGWEFRVYFDCSVPSQLLQTLYNNGATLINMETAHIENKMLWRFLVAADPTVDRFIVRDADARLSMRDKLAVNEWIRSNQTFHIVRDHPSHSEHPMSGGLWGATSMAAPFIKTLSRQVKDARYFQDMIFLREHVWPIAKQSVLQHDDWSCQHEEFNQYGLISFPSKRVGTEHVGSVHLEYNASEREIDATILKNALPSPCLFLRQAKTIKTKQASLNVSSLTGNARHPTPGDKKWVIAYSLYNSHR